MTIRGCRRRLPAITLCGLQLLCGRYYLITAKAQSLSAAPNSAAPNSPLPVRRVTLFTSGVACTERSGDVTGNAAVPINFRTAQINDILKSLVLLDKSGKVQPATYASRDPIARTLEGFSVDVSDNLSRSDLLTKLRGAEVTIEQPGKPPVTGQIMSIENRQVSAEGGKPISAAFINLLTDSGITSFPLDTECTVRVLDTRVRGELHEALALLASSSDTQRRQVLLHFAGVGRREVHIAYITEAPIWKISYRLLLGGAAGKDTKALPYMQGWAMVENTSDEDWNGVRLSLVSGRPVSFIQDLYQPLYIHRPEVGPDVVASPYPQTHDDNLLAEQKAPVAQTHAPEVTRRFKDASKSGGRSMLPEGIKAEDLTALSNNNTIIEIDRSSLGITADRARTSVTSQATGAHAGEMFQYSILSPINLPRQQAAMIPVIARDIAGERVSIYNADNDGRFAMNAIRLRNTTGMHLKGGPITLFDGGNYAGDARLEDLPPGESRLISYAVDMAMLCNRAGSQVATINTVITVHRGVLTETRKERVETQYTIKSRSDSPRTVLVEHPIVEEHHLVTPQHATERTGNLYRFTVTVPPRETRTLRIVTERPLLTSVSIRETSMETLADYSNLGAVSPKLKNQLNEVIRKRRAIDALKSKATATAAEIGAINEDQERIRKNMGALDHGAALYKRYVATLDGQESHIGGIRKAVASLNQQVSAAEQALRAYEDQINP